MSTFSEDQFEKKLLALKDTHESISSLSAWCLEYPQQHKKIVSIWLQVLKKVKIEQRLTLFYLANDVIQYSKRKGFDFVESWGTALQKATTMVRDDKVKNKILRLFKIWDERSIYDEAFLVDLSGLLSSRKPAQSNQDAQDFQPAILITKIRNCKTLEDDTDFKRKIVNDSHLSLNDADALHSFLKDRRHGADLEQELDEGMDKMMAYITALKAEIKDRGSLIEMLDLSDSFYENQRGEAKIVCNAYRNFSKRVENLKKKLDELTSSLPSPVPSPDINAPSPSPESDIDLPDDNMPGKYSTASSFIGTLVVPEHMQLSNSADGMYNLAKDSPPRKISYKPPTPPRSYKRKSSPKPFHSPPPAAYISSTTPTPSSSSASNYSSPSPYHPVTKNSSYTPNTASYSIPSVATSRNEEPYAPTTTYLAHDSYSEMYNPEDNELVFNAPSPGSYHIPGANPPPPPPYTTSGRNPSPEATYDLTTNSSTAFQSSTTYNSRKFQSSRSFDNPPPSAAPPPDYSVPPPTVNEYNGTLRPFYSTSTNLTMPPLLGEDCPPSAINGLDSFLQGDSVNEDSPNPPPLLSSGFSSFMGNMNLPFDFQKGLFSDVSCEETPASPPPTENVLDDSTSQIGYFSDSNNDGEGKPIEVINRTKQPDLSEILKAINMQGNGGGSKARLELSTPSPSIPPPPLPPSTVLVDDYPSEPEDHDKPWSQPPLLPPKFPTWGQDDWVDTPASPPLYEKTGFGEPIEFEETDSLVLGDTDTDLRSLGLQGDIDHRNLISLTSSPRDEAVWTSATDTDYRKLVLAPKRGAQDDNVESVDMEMSSDEEIEAEAAKPAVSFSLPTQNKSLVVSPLVEKEEPKVKKLLNIVINPPPRLPEPPPLPNVDEIFPELDSGGEADEVVEKIPSPPVPPPPPPMPIPQLQSVHEVPVLNPTGGFPHQRPPRGFFGPRFNNQRQRFSPWQGNPNNNMRPRPPLPMTGPAYPFRPDSNFRGRPPWFRGNARPPRYGGW